jgi:2-polyprenyl-3-methyl-5-hydroxy-6-metoxy-1,4-benzoquinol methylase
MVDHEVERAADWDEQWRQEPLRLDAPDHEARTLRWRGQEALVRERFGSIEGLRIVEIGAGRGLNALLFAKLGAQATLLDQSPVALEQAKALFDAHSVPVELVEADLFELPESIRGGFDVSMSYGLCEHFLGERRQEVIAAHLAALQPGGLALLGVPNKLAPVYRLWMATLKRRGSWPLGTEVPFTASELRLRARVAGGEPLPTIRGSFAGSVVDHGVNQVLFKLGRKGLPVPQVRTPVLDLFAYELLVPVRNPAA